jgi:hypothetical protein
LGAGSEIAYRFPPQTVLKYGTFVLFKSKRGLAFSRSLDKGNAAPVRPAVPAARVYVLLRNACDGNALAGAITARTHGRGQPLDVADDAYMAPRDFVFNIRIDDDVALVRGARPAVQRARPFNFHTAFNVVKDVVLTEEL